MGLSNIVIMPTPREMHPTDDELELYALGRMSETQTTPLEEHLLECSACQERLRDLDEYVAAMRQALQELEADSKVEGIAERKHRLAWLFSVPKPVWASAMAAFVVLALFLPSLRNAGPAYEVSLYSFRSDAAGAPQTVPAGRNLDLTIDITGLPETAAYQVEIADSTGSIVFSTLCPRSGDTVIAGVDSDLDAGQYWVRIYAPAESSGAELLREFGLAVQ